MDLHLPAAAEDRSVKNGSSVEAINPEKFEHTTVSNTQYPGNKDSNEITVLKIDSDKEEEESSGARIHEVPSSETNACKDDSLENVSSLVAGAVSQDMPHVNKEEDTIKEQAGATEPQRSSKKLLRCK